VIENTTNDDEESKLKDVTNLNIRRGFLLMLTSVVHPCTEGPVVENSGELFIKDISYTRPAKLKRHKNHFSQNLTLVKSG
jgi:hypothetical protein